MRSIKYISQKLRVNSSLGEYNEALKALEAAASKLGEDLELQVTLLDKSETYSVTNKTVKDVRNLEFLYSHKAIQREPKLALEYSKIAEAINLINKTTALRRRENFKFKEKQTKKFQKEEVSNEH